MYPVKPLFGFISTGDKIAMYTLRIVYLCEAVIQGETHVFNKDYYIKNLSNDKAKAECLALEICEMQGIPFKGNAEFELNEIRRVRDAESAERRSALEREERLAEEQVKEVYERQMQDGVILFGKYLGNSAAELHEADVSYFFWLRNQVIDASELSPFAVSVRIVKELEVKETAYVGEIDSVFEGLVTVKTINAFTGMYGTSYAFTVTTEDGDYISFFSTAKKLLALEPGDVVKITSLIYQHKQYNGIKQTVIKKPKIVK